MFLFSLWCVSTLGRVHRLPNMPRGAGGKSGVGRRGGCGFGGGGGLLEGIVTGVVVVCGSGSGKLLASLECVV